MSQRLEVALAATQEDANSSAVRAQYGISRTAGYTWLRRFQAAVAPPDASGRRSAGARPARTGVTPIWWTGQQSLWNWVKRAEIDAGRGVPEHLSTDERAELTRLRRENRLLQQEREILKKAAAFFAKETS